MEIRVKSGSSGFLCAFFNKGVVSYGENNHERAGNGLADDIIPEGSRNKTMFHSAVCILKRFGNTEDAREFFRKKSDKCVPPPDHKELNG